MAGFLGLALPIVSAISGLFGSDSKESSKSSTSYTKDSTRGTSGVQTDLPPELLEQLGGLFGGIVGNNAGQQGQDATVKRLNQLSTFDPEAYAKSVTDQASSVAGLSLESGTNAASMAAGGRGNTMTSLLNNKLRNETAANLAGITAQARATGEDIANKGVAGLNESIMRGITDLVAVTRGAATTGTMGEKIGESGKGSETGSTSTSSGGGLGGFFSGLTSGLNTYWNSVRQ